MQNGDQANFTDWSIKQFGILVIWSGVFFIQTCKNCSNCCKIQPNERKTIIFELEALAVMAGCTLLLPCETIFPNDRFVIFVDNDAVLSRLVSGKGGGLVDNLIFQRTLLWEFETKSIAWYERVPLAANVADAPSRGDVSGLDESLEMARNVSDVLEWKKADCASVSCKHRQQIFKFLWEKGRLAKIFTDQPATNLRVPKLQREKMNLLQISIRRLNAWWKSPHKKREVFAVASWAATWNQPFNQRFEPQPNQQSEQHSDARSAMYHPLTRQMMSGCDLVSFCSNIDTRLVTKTLTTTNYANFIVPQFYPVIHSKTHDFFGYLTKSCPWKVTLNFILRSKGKHPN